VVEAHHGGGFQPITGRGTKIRTTKRYTGCGWQIFR
jgi:hypothetical protein